MNVRMILLIALSVSAISYISNAETEDDNKKVHIAVQTISIKPQSFKEYGTYYGTVRGAEQSTLTVYKAGRVEKIIAKVGQKVKAGDSLCAIERQRFQLMYDSTSLAERIAKQKFDRTKLHRKSGGTSKLQEDQGRLAWIQAQSNQIEADKILKGALCISPIEGTVVERHIEAHQDVMAGQSTFTIAALDYVKIYVGIPESVIKGYDIGADVQIEIKSEPGKIFEGKLVALSQGLAKSTQSFQGEIHLPNPNHSLKPGHTAKITITRLNLNDAFVIPISSIISKVSKKVVMVVNNHTAHERTVVIDAENKDRALISNGLNLNDQLIIKGHRQVIDGSLVTVVKEKEPSAAK